MFFSGFSMLRRTIPIWNSRWSTARSSRSTAMVRAQTYGPPRRQAVCIERSEQSAKTYPAFRHRAVGQDGDPRVLVLIKGPASCAILRHRVPEHRSTVRPSSLTSRRHHPAVASLRPISFTLAASSLRTCVRDAAMPKRYAPLAASATTTVLGCARDKSPRSQAPMRVSLLLTVGSDDRAPWIRILRR